MVSATVVVWLRILSTAQWLYDETGSAALVGGIGVVQLLVQVPALLWGGALADHIDRKKLMILANGLTCLAMLGLGLLDAGGLLTPLAVYTGIALTAASQMLANPARSAMVPIVIPKQHLLLAASTDTASQNASAIVGPLIFAGIAVAFGITEAFFAGAAIAASSALFPLFIRSHGIAEGHDDDAPESAVQQTWEGLRYVSRHPILPGLFLLDAGITTASFYREILPVLALGLFAGGASATGLLGAANSTGAIIGSFIALLFVGYRAKGRLVLYASLAYAVILFGFGTANSLWMGMLMIGLLGAADAVTVAVRQTTVMLTTPDQMRGRAFALMILAAQTANNVGRHRCWKHHGPGGIHLHRSDAGDWLFLETDQGVPS
jgi:MFS family permease